MSAELTPAWRCFFGSYEALRRLGFKSEDIYANFHDGIGADGPSLYILVKTPTRSEDHFQIRMGVAEQATYAKEYAELSKLWNDPSSQPLRREIYQEWLGRVGGWSLISILLSNGIPIPNQDHVATSPASEETVH